MIAQTEAKRVGTRYSPLAKANPAFYTILLAGGPGDIFRKIQKKLAEKKGVYVKYHWEYHTNAFQGVIHKDVDWVLYLKDMASHSDFDAIKEECRKRGKPMISTASEWSTMNMALNNRGIITTAPLDLDMIDKPDLRIVREGDSPLPKEPEPPKFHEIPPEIKLLGKKQISLNTFSLIQQLQQALDSEGIQVIMISNSSIEINNTAKETMPRA